MTRALANAGSRPVAWIGAFTALSWLGEFIHNRIELPQLSLPSPENSAVAFVSMVLFFLWWWFPKSRIPGILLLAWALLHFIGGAIITVIPFQFLPFYPEQSVTHYLAHMVYGLAQLPLIVSLLRQIRRTAPQRTVVSQQI